MADANPYHPGRPTDPASFVGREHILDGVMEYLKSEKADSVDDVGIMGRRGMGKTSILLKIRSIAPPECLMIYLPGKRWNENELVEELLQTIEREVRARLKESVSYIDLVGALRRGNKSGTSTLIDAISRLADLRVFLLLDDAHLLDPKALATLKSAFFLLRTINGVPACLILASESGNMMRLAKGGLGPSESFRIEFQLERFTKDEVKLLLTKPFGKWTPRTVDHVYSMSKGHPVAIQMYGAAYYKLAEPAGALELPVSAIPQPKSLDKSSSLTDEFHNIAYTLSKEYKMAEFQKKADELIIRCDRDVRNRFYSWYKIGWKREPSEEEDQVLTVIANRGGEARFRKIKDAYGKNPAPQLKRAVEKGVIEQISRGLYALPHPIIAEFLKQGSPKQNKKSVASK